MYIKQTKHTVASSLLVPLLTGNFWTEPPVQSPLCSSTVWAAWRLESFCDLWPTASFTGLQLMLALKQHRGQRWVCVAIYCSTNSNTVSRAADLRSRGSCQPITCSDCSPTRWHHWGLNQINSEWTPYWNRFTELLHFLLSHLSLDAKNMHQFRVHCVFQTWQIESISFFL